MNGYRCLVIVGAQWGDEGKGKIVDVLAQEADIIVRYQGGANAGHTVHVGTDEFILHQIPSGILHSGKRCLLGNGVVLDLEHFFEELDTLERRGVATQGRIGVSARAHLLLEYHRIVDRNSEERLGQSKIGTTGKGIGPAYEDKVARVGVRAADLRLPERAEPLIRRAAERAEARLRLAGAVTTFDIDSIVRRTLDLGHRLLPLLTDTGEEVDRALRAGRRVLLEGAQGALLDVDHGTYPFVTSSNTTAGGAATGVGIGPTALDAVLGVVKAYTTRVGSGPLPTELADPLGAHLRELGGEYGATTGRPRRCGWFDAVVLRYAARVNGLTGLALTKLDVLDSFEEIKIATGYRLPKGESGEFAGDLDLLGRVEPIYETVRGWNSRTSDARSYEDLPPAARQYLSRIEALTGVPIWFVSVGTEREQIIRVRA
ncbi:MAG: adenylosuccinate synthase [Longimicrobiales bacterium]